MPEKKANGLLFDLIDQVSCKHCGSFVTLTGTRPLSLIPCPHCGGKVFVAVRLANFLIHDNIGEGEMGSIYRATDETLDREVAIKLLRGSYAGDPESCERLRKEACALGRLNHPRVAQVYALSFSNGHPYLVMELVTGQDFSKKVQEEGHLDERVVLRMAGDVAEGLAALNREGLVHSDIKPANIVMDRDGNSKLVDFGLTGMVRYDSNHNLMGTPDYIAPELIYGEKDTMRSDIFSLGATLYHLLSGRTPTPGLNATEVLKTRIDKIPITPLSEVAPQVSPATCKLVMKMLEYHPDDRLQNSDILAYEVKEALRALDVPRPPEQPGVAPVQDTAWAFGQQDNTALSEEDKANAREVMDSLYASPPNSFEPPEPPPSEPEGKAKQPKKRGGMIFFLLLLIIGAVAVAVQYPPCDKVWNMGCYHVSIYVNELAKRHPAVDSALKWSGEKFGALKSLVVETFGKPSVQLTPLLPVLSDFTEETKQLWQITNLGSQAKSGSTVQTGGALMIQLPGIAVDKWGSWRNGYDHSRFIWSKVTTNHYAFSARFASMATQDPLDVTGIQVKGTDASTAPWILFGFLGNGELFLQVRNTDNKAVIVKHVKASALELKYLMLVRRGGLFEALHSTDGRSWTPFGRCTLDLPSEHVIGFSVSTLAPNKFATVRFDGMSLKLPRNDKK
jgi:serine/threonine protein kinase